MAAIKSLDIPLQSSIVIPFAINLATISGWTISFAISSSSITDSIGIITVLTGASSTNSGAGSLIRL